MESLDYLLSKALAGRLQVLVDGLSRGSPTDYPEYCKLVGEIRGLLFAQAALADALKSMGTEENE